MLVEVPNLTGKSFETEREEAKKIGLYINMKEEVFSNDIKEGHIVSQSVEPNLRIKKNTEILVNVSKGKEYITVPSVINAEYTEAEKILKNSKLKSSNLRYLYWRIHIIC